MKLLNHETLLEFLISSSSEEIKTHIKEIHPMDIIDVFNNISDKIIIKEIIKKLPDETIALVLDFESNKNKAIVLNLIDYSRHKAILNIMSSDELTDLIESVDDDTKHHLLSLIEESEDIKSLLSHKADTAGALMTNEFINIYETKTVLKTYQYLQAVTRDNNEMAYYLYITDKEDHLKGVISLKDLIASPFDKNIKDITNHNVYSVHVDTDQEEVAYIFDKYDYIMLPVVDDNNVLVGVISIDDIIDVVIEESTEDIHRLAGIDEDEKVDGRFIDSLKSRLPWLLVNLFTASLSAAVITSFSETIQAVVVLAAINPIIAGMGGNAGNQSMTLIVRSIALKQINVKNALKVFFKELKVGIMFGLILGFILATAISLIYQNIYLGLVAGLAILFNLIIATTVGFLVPFTMHKLKIDPALASGVFVTATTDILGFLIFLSLASIALPYLL